MTQQLFVDGSVNNHSKIGYGAFLHLSGEDIMFEELKEQIKVKQFEGTSSSKLELQTLLWGLKCINPKGKIKIYTDSQNIIGLLDRRKKLVKNNFKSQNNRLISNHELYEKFYEVCDQITAEFIKVSGHMKSNEKEAIDHIFTLVDRASRNALRNSV